MGLRRWIDRTVRGIRDPTRGNEGYSADRQREWTTDTIDKSGFQWWVVVVAGIGFLTDSYDIFALNVVNPMLGYVYWPETGKMPSGYKTGMMCSTLAGTMVGQIAFGVAADFLGRRKMYGLELIIIIVATLLFALSSRGAADSMSIGGWLITWRFIMGVGIGADYPLSAVITSEFAPRKHRARMISTVFFMQPVGQLLATVISLAVVKSWESRIPNKSVELGCDSNDECLQKMAYTCSQNDNCIRAIDGIWRLVVALGIVPALIALAFRLTIPESPRYKMDIKKKMEKASEDTDNFYGREFDIEESMQLNYQPKHHDNRDSIAQSVITPSPLVSPGFGRSPSRFDSIAPEEEVLNLDDDTEFVEEPINRAVTTPVSHLPDPLADPPLASRQDMYDYFITQGNWLWLTGTCLSWLFLDFAFYGLGLSSPDILSHIWAPGVDKKAVYDTLYDNAAQYLILVSIGAVVGGAIMIKVVKFISPKTIQLWGFIVLAILFIVTGSVWGVLLRPETNTKPTGLYVLYGLCMLVFNLGPNTVTFLVPAEIFPTRYRATCHGVSAAAGKLGSWIAQLFLAFVPFMRNGETQLGHVLQVMAGFMLAGAAVTFYMIPETRDREGKSRTLETLALGRRGLEILQQDEKRRRRVAKEAGERSNMESRAGLE